MTGQTFKLVQAVLAGLSGKEVPTRRAVLRELGMAGFLTALLNDGTRLRIPEREWGTRAKRPPSDKPSGVHKFSSIVAAMSGWPLGWGGTLRRALSSGGWSVLAAGLLGHPWAHKPARRRFLQLALVEAVAFSEAGFSLSECDHGKHFYLTDDRRRKDCSAHQLAGQQARHRLNKREEGVLENLERQSLTEEELRRAVGLRRRTLRQTVSALLEKGHAEIRVAGGVRRLSMTAAGGSRLRWLQTKGVRS